MILLAPAPTLGDRSVGASRRPHRQRLGGPVKDFIQRFIFEDFNVRGEIVQLDQAWREVHGKGEYDAGTRDLLGQMLAATALLSDTIKISGSLVLQLKTDAYLKLMMAECRHHRDLRAIARVDAGKPRDLAAPGNLAITIEPDGGERYQGIVSYDGGPLAPALELYFARSEQLGTRLWLAADGESAAGLMLQELPGEKEGQVEDDFRRVCLLADTLGNRELLDTEALPLLTRLFHEERVRVFEPRALRFHCSCSRERSANAIKFLGYDDAMELVESQGRVEIDCQFCHARYRYDGDDVASVFAGEAPPAGTVIH
jgi:molecular chaperone Hsp33